MITRYVSVGLAKSSLAYTSGWDTAIRRSLKSGPADPLFGRDKWSHPTLLFIRYFSCCRSPSNSRLANRDAVRNTGISSSIKGQLSPIEFGVVETNRTKHTPGARSARSIDLESKVLSKLSIALAVYGRHCVCTIPNTGFRIGSLGRSKCLTRLIPFLRRVPARLLAPSFLLDLNALLADPSDHGASLIKIEADFAFERAETRLKITPVP